MKVMKRLGGYQIINPDGPQEHLKKENIPTAGGVSFLLSITIGVLLFANITNAYVFIPLIAMWGFGLVGLVDDILKLKKRDSIGLTSLRKLAMQVLAAAFLYYIVNQTSGLMLTRVSAFWNPQKSIDIGLWFPIAFLLYMVVFVNAVNISDGLDGLATSVTISPLFLLFAIAALFAFAQDITPTQPVIISGASDLLIVIAIVIGALLAFLWFNGYKAELFMGDVGSHAIGAFIGVSALLMKIEIIIAFASGVIMVELISSFIQIVSLRMYKKKVFLLAPLHHHFELKGVHESKIVTRFYIVSIVLTLVATLFFMVKYQ
jgi:phospho-N-acetylmuramoyl-pentapeptide-transferase